MTLRLIRYCVGLFLNDKSIEIANSQNINILLFD